MAKKYTAELTQTQEMADKSHGGVIYYFCHIHSKMSGKIIIQNEDGTPYVPSANPTQWAVYSPYSPAGADTTCGTFDAKDYAGGGSKACQERFICGSLDTNFEKCMQAIDCKMKQDMLHRTTADHTDKVAVFMQQMIPHHENAVNMAKILLKEASASDITNAMDEDGLTDILFSIINVQNYQIHQFRNYLGPTESPTSAPTSLPDTSAPTASPHTHVSLGQHRHAPLDFVLLLAAVCQVLPFLIKQF
jgi:hypothetical protein